MNTETLALEVLIRALSETNSHTQLFLWLSGYRSALEYGTLVYGTEGQIKLQERELTNPHNKGYNAGIRAWKDYLSR